MPLRDLLHALGAPTDLVPRDAVAGTGPAVLELPGGVKLATVISWEVFFGGRANEGVEAGGDAIINPTNGSSYTWTVLQSQQVASSRLRAIEQNRWVVQVAPTGFSAFISPSGDVYDRTSISEQQVITRSIELHGGIRTWYSHTGDIPWVVLVALVLALAVFRARRTSPGLYVQAVGRGPGAVSPDAVRTAEVEGSVAADEAVSSPAPGSASEAPPH
jgi:apolipoprotein N-acyltransferase